MGWKSKPSKRRSRRGARAELASVDRAGGRSDSHAYIKQIHMHRDAQPATGAIDGLIDQDAASIDGLLAAWRGAAHKPSS